MGKRTPDRGQALANLAGLVAEALMRYRMSLGEAYGVSVTTANVLNANPQVMQDLLNSIEEEQ